MVIWHTLPEIKKDYVSVDYLKFKVTFPQLPQHMTRQLQIYMAACCNSTLQKDAEQYPPGLVQDKLVHKFLHSSLRLS